MSGVFVIAVTLLVTIIITILNPNTIYNWRLASPILVTSLARANISPSFTLMIFKVGDSQTCPVDDPLRTALPVLIQHHRLLQIQSFLLTSSGCKM